MRAAAVLLVLGLFVPHIASCLKICAFNVQSFGESKASNKKIMEILLKVPRARPREQPPREERISHLPLSPPPLDPLSVRPVPPPGGAGLQGPSRPGLGEGSEQV